MATGKTFKTYPKRDYTRQYLFSSVIYSDDTYNADIYQDQTLRSFHNHPSGLIDVCSMLDSQLEKSNPSFSDGFVFTESILKWFMDEKGSCRAIPRNPDGTYRCSVNVYSMTAGTNGTGDWFIRMNRPSIVNNMNVLFHSISKS